MLNVFKYGASNSELFMTLSYVSKLYGVNATIIIFVFVLYCIVLFCTSPKHLAASRPLTTTHDHSQPLRTSSRRTFCAESCLQTRRSTASEGWPPTAEETPCLEHSTTALSALLCTARVTFEAFEWVCWRGVV